MLTGHSTVAHPEGERSPARKPSPADAELAAPMQDALVALDAISARMPEVDAVRLVREGREQLGVRSA